MSADPAFLAGALALYLISMVAAGVRWLIVLRALGVGATWQDAVLINAAGVFVNNTTPASRLGGEASRVALVQRRAGASLADATLSVVCDRLTDIPPVAALALATLPAVRAWPLLAAGVLAAAIGFTLFRVLRGRGRGTRVEPSTAWGAWWKRMSRSRHALGPAVCCSMVIWAQDVARLWLVGAACGIPFSLPQVALLSIVGVIGGLAPTVGGLGVIEAGLFGTVLAFGVPAAPAAAVVALERAISYGVGTAAGGGAMIYLGGQVLWTVSGSRSRATGSRLE